MSTEINWIRSLFNGVLSTSGFCCQRDIYLITNDKVGVNHGTVSCDPVIYITNICLMGLRKFMKISLNTCYGQALLVFIKIGIRCTEKNTDPLYKHASHFLKKFKYMSFA
jgi:hypothetical protein